MSQSELNVQNNPQTKLQCTQNGATVVPVNDTRTQCTTPVPRVAPTMQSSIFPAPSAFAMMVPVGAESDSGQPSQVAPTIPVKVPMLEETKATFGEVSSAF